MQDANSPLRETQNRQAVLRFGCLSADGEAGPVSLVERCFSETAGDVYLQDFGFRFQTCGCCSGL